MAKIRNQRTGGRARERSEFDQQVLDIRRTARVAAGGRRFSFRATVVVGDRKGRVGLGIGKGADVSVAIEKAVARGKKNLISVPLSNGNTIASVVEGKVAAARVILKPAREGRGMVAGGPIRAIAALAGIKDLTAKILGRTQNKLNNAQAAIEALKKLRNTKEYETTKN